MLCSCVPLIKGLLVSLNNVDIQVTYVAYWYEAENKNKTFCLKKEAAASTEMLRPLN